MSGWRAAIDKAWALLFVRSLAERPQIGKLSRQECRQALLFCEQKRSKKNFAPFDRAGGTASGFVETLF
jgi:hypothetical protein